MDSSLQIAGAIRSEDERGGESVQQMQQRAKANQKCEAGTLGRGTFPRFWRLGCGLLSNLLHDQSRQERQAKG